MTYSLFISLAPACSQHTLKSIHQCRQPLHELAQNSFVNWLQNRVEVIWHQAESKNLDRMPSLRVSH